MIIAHFKLNVNPFNVMTISFSVQMYTYIYRKKYIDENFL